ncbi:GNAT family N-acetyltransferase [Flexibacterium corallicola]|uniref:GNAT family N-acetyltransferase n=1 Tax=Flexibacterium corallicola TaxID=3037259 RepID=UPI00286F09DB|nr:GNAT family N-acetyltransferase [Pseudovibrio sp. M1P-2-3]
MSIRVFNLCEKPELVHAVAQCAWSEWVSHWQESGKTHEALLADKKRHLAPDSLPTTFVALEDDQFIGFVSLIEEDVSRCPELVPQVASLVVEPRFRGRGFAKQLLEAVVDHGHARGFSSIYLCAAPSLSVFYRNYGWQLIDEDADGLFVFKRVAFESTTLV